VTHRMTVPLESRKFRGATLWQNNEHCAWLAQNAKLGPTVWLKIPIRALQSAHNLGQLLTIFVSGIKPILRITAWYSREGLQEGESSAT
jgi:hypothetical protein